MVNANEAAAVVTGHSRGIGEAVAEHLLARGARVLGVSRHGNAAPRGAISRTRLEEVALDVADGVALARWLAGNPLERFLGESETPLLVNNAGVLQPIGTSRDARRRAGWRAVAVNLGAALVLSAAFVQATADAKERRILHVSSGAARKAYAGWSVYCATKAALDHHARCVALDRTPGLLISSVAPGVVDTEMQAEIRASTDERFPDRPAIRRRCTATRRCRAPTRPALGSSSICYQTSSAPSRCSSSTSILIECMTLVRHGACPYSAVAQPRVVSSTVNGGEDAETLANERDTDVDGRSLAGCRGSGANNPPSTSNGDVSTPSAATTATSAAPIPPPEHHSKLAGAAVGAVVGHELGGHALAGAAVGAAVQHHRNKKARY